MWLQNNWMGDQMLTVTRDREITQRMRGRYRYIMVPDADEDCVFLSGTGREWLYETSHERTVLIQPKEFSEAFINAEDYPALAAVWDNDADAIFDNM